MIPYQAALTGWILVSFLLMADRNSARGFSLAYLLALLFMPAGREIDLPSVPDLTKYNVATIGVFLGTIVFHPRLFDRYRFELPDLLLFFSIPLVMLTSYLNDYGYYDGLARSFGFVFNFMLPILLARIHLGTPGSLRLFLLIIVGLSVIYLPFVAWEFRMSPQTHTTVYGYFQHVFQQHARGAFWRPIVFFRHGLDLARFFAFASFLALFPLRRELVRLIGPYGKYVFLFPLFGLVLSQSNGPMMMFALMCLAYFAVRRHAWLGYMVPLVGWGWLMLVQMGYQPGYALVESFSPFSEERTQSLTYRLIALLEYRDIIMNKPWFGYGGWGGGRIEGRATDSLVLISLLTRGFIGSIVYFGWWWATLHVAFRARKMSQGLVLHEMTASVACLLSLGLLVSTIDAALDQYVLFTGAAMYPIHAWLRTKPAVEELQRSAALNYAQPQTG